MRVAEQVEPDRLGLAGGEQVDDAAAHGEFARLHHRAGAAVAVALRESAPAPRAVDVAARRAASGWRLRRRRAAARAAPAR